MKNRLNKANFNLFSKNTLGLAKIYVPAFLLVVAIWAIEKISDISTYELVADPNEVGQIAPYVGLVSTLGLFILCSGVSACFFCSYLIDGNDKDERQWRLFFRCSGCFLLIMLFDDAFQLHENFSTLIFGVDANISTTNKRLQNLLETFVFGAYGLLFFLYGFNFRKIICRTEILPLLLALCFFVASTIIDVLFENMKGHFVLEEGFKLLGIVSLITYYVKASYQKAKNLL